MKVLKIYRTFCILSNGEYTFMATRDYRNRNEIASYIDRNGELQVVEYYSVYGVQIRGVMEPIAWPRK